MIRSGRVRAGAGGRGAALRVALAMVAGALLAGALLVAWSCRTTRSAIVPVAPLSESLDITSAEGTQSRPEPMMRVRIAREIESAKLDGRGPWLIAVEGARTGEILSGPVTVSASTGGVRVADGQGRVRGFAAGTTVYAGPVLGHTERTGDEIVSFNGMRYPGTLRFVPDEGAATRFDVVNIVEIERYIPGVIGKELFPHWDEKAFMAQAVAARTFALSRRESARKANRAYDVDDSTVDQVYGGLTGQRVAIRAAEETRGVVLTNAGKLGEAFYSATCGGKPALATEVWPPAPAPAVRTVGYTPPPPPIEPTGFGLSREILCQGAPLFQWEVARKTDELTKRLQAWGKGRKHDLGSIGRLAKVEVTERSTMGRAMWVRVTDSGGKSVTLSAEHFRNACNAPAEGLPEIPTIAMVSSGDVSVEVNRSVTVIRGSGHGHGVGMCQYCAQGMAKRGDDWRVILQSFYPELSITRIY